MCNETGIAFVHSHLVADEITGKRVLESGSQDVNGSVRPDVETLHPAEYIGTDMQAGHRVDQVCRAEDLIAAFGEDRFDVVISTELFEHVEDWRAVLHNWKTVLKPGGVIYVTTRSKGFGYHGYPADFWRYETYDLGNLFADFEILALEKDSKEPGVFIKARKPQHWVERDLSAYPLYSMATQSGGLTVQGAAPKSFYTGLPGWETEAEQTYLLQLAQQVPKDGDILEIGGEYGMSASLFCQGAKVGVHITTVDLFPGDLLDKHRANLKAAGYEGDSIQIVGDSGEVALTWDKGKIDLLFVDGDHTYEGVRRDLAWLKHVAVGGIVVFHDCACATNKLPHYLHFEVTRAISEWFGTSKGKWKPLQPVDTMLSFERLK